MSIFDVEPPACPHCGEPMQPDLQLCWAGRPYASHAIPERSGWVFVHRCADGSVCRRNLESAVAAD